MYHVAIVDYGSSNLRSVAKALNHVAGSHHRIAITDQPEQIRSADYIVIPGQGAIGQCMAGITGKGLEQVLRECLAEKPFLGICMGLQILMTQSDEDHGTRGLGVFPGSVIRFPDGAQDADGATCKIPHMGWNRVLPAHAHPLWNNIDPGERFYFVHSYHVVPDAGDDIAATTDYAVTFNSALARDNLFAVQFHPEKSQAAGLTLLRNFIDWRV